MLLLLRVCSLLVLLWSDFVRPCDHADLTRQLHTLAMNHSSIAYLHNIGYSYDGKELWVMSLGDSVALRPILRPQVKLVGNYNGFSGPACAVLVNLVKELLEGYWIVGSEERELLQSLEVQVLFDMNPDGYAKSSKGSCTDKRGRENGNNKQLNKDFPPVFPDDGDEGHVPQPETQAVMGWMDSSSFVLSLSLVAGHTAVVIPFDDKLSLLDEPHVTPDNDAFVYLATKYLGSVGWKSSWNCAALKRSFAHGWVNGAEWYAARGTMMDYSYIRAATPELTIGLSCCRNEDDEGALKQIYVTHKKGLYTLLHEASLALRGQVVDSVTKDVLEGVMLSRVDDSISLPAVPWFTSPQGEFWRLLPPATYVLEVRKEGYKSARVEMQVSPDQATVLTIPLDPLGLQFLLHKPQDHQEQDDEESEDIHTTPTPPTSPANTSHTLDNKDVFDNGLGVLLGGDRSPSTKPPPNISLTTISTVVTVDNHVEEKSPQEVKTVGTFDSGVVVMARFALRSSSTTSLPLPLCLTFLSALILFCRVAM